MSHSHQRYNIRVYGIFIKNNAVLVSDEYRFNTPMTKFPGGGLEKGEGIAECILRECKEEFGQDFKIVKHYYTTDFYIESAFHPGVQLISIYYLIDSSEEIKFQTHQIPHHYKAIEGAQSFRWIELSSLKKEDFTYPIDQLIAEKLYADFGNKN